MKTIPLTNNEFKFIFVDDIDYDDLIKYKWRLDKDGYAVRAFRTKGRIKTIMLHWQIGFKFHDHIDRDRLNNLRNNFRPATKSQNQCNQDKRNGKYSSIYKGVCWNKINKRWIASIMIKGKYIHIGSFLSEIEAAKEYNKFAIELHKEFAVLNIIKEEV